MDSKKNIMKMVAFYMNLIIKMTKKMEKLLHTQKTEEKNMKLIIKMAKNLD